MLVSVSKFFRFSGKNIHPWNLLLETPVSTPSGTGVEGGVIGILEHAFKADSEDEIVEEELETLSLKVEIG